MIYIVLRSGKTLQYNKGEACTVEENCVVVRPRDRKSLIARIPCDVVERAEFDRPCRVYKERPLR